VTDKSIAVIPARGGSKRIPRKNIRDFCGKPMIAWSIEIAKASNLFDHVIISTDDTEIANIAMQYEVPFIRSEDLSGDFVGTAEVIQHATEWVINKFGSINTLCCLYPTAPFVQATDLKRGLDAIKTGEWDYAFSVTDFSAPIFRSFKQNAHGGIEMFFPEHFSTRSQDLPVALHDAGQFYWGRPEAWLNKKRVFSDTSFPVFIPRWRVQDIDTEEDFKNAELMFTAFKSQLVEP
jgi:pseudaminic acid cytidylyltransferase